MTGFLQVLVSGLLSGGIYAVVSVGLTLIFGVLKLVNFAHGDFLMVSMYMSFWLYSALSVNPYVGALFVVPLMFAFGVLIQRILMKPILEAPHVVQIFATMGLSMILQNAALLLFKADFRNVRVPFAASVLQIGGIRLSLVHVVAFLVAMTAAVVLYAFLQSTDMGKAMRAVSMNARAAKLMGINVDRVYLVAYSLGIALVGLAGVFLTPIYPIYPTIGLNFANPAFVCVVLGGLGSVPGAVLGGLTIGLVEAMTAYYAGSQFQQAAYFLIFLVVLVIRPYGFFGRKGAEVAQ